MAALGYHNSRRGFLGFLRTFNFQGPTDSVARPVAGVIPAMAIVDSDGNPATPGGTPTSASTRRNVPVSTSAVQLLPPNAARTRDTIANDSTSILYVLEGSVAQAGEVSSTNYTYYIVGKTSQPGFYEADSWKGEVRGIWSAADASGAARITERS